jgi:TonB family protein
VQQIDWITYEQGNIPVELVGEGEWRRAIGKSEIRADTLVTVYRGSEQPRVAAAADVPELASIFAEFAPPPAAPTPEPPQPPPPTPRGHELALATEVSAKGPELSPAYSEQLPEDDGVDLDGGDLTPRPPYPSWAPPASPGSFDTPPTTNPLKPLWIVAAIIIGLAAIGTCTGQRQTTPTILNTTVAPGLNGMDMDPMGGNMMGPLEPSTPPVVAFLVRETNVREGPSSSSRLVTALPRGERIEGVVVPGDRDSNWLRLSQGPFAGYYVAQSNVSSQPRPPLDTSAAGTFDIGPGTLIRAEPSSESAVLQRVEEWTSVEVVGRTGDMAEVALRDGRIGYVELSAFDQSEEGADEELGYEPASPESTDAPITEPMIGSNVYEPARRVAGSISNDDYPASSIRAGEEGTTTVSIEVGPTGFVTGCSVTGSSGFASLDVAACSAVRRRFRYQPARQGGRPVSSSDTYRINWRLAGD